MMPDRTSSKATLQLMAVSCVIQQLSIRQFDECSDKETKHAKMAGPNSEVGTEKPEGNRLSEKYTKNP
jgi:hypothetical protein